MSRVVFELGIDDDKSLYPVEEEDETGYQALLQSAGIGRAGGPGDVWDEKSGNYLTAV